MDPLVCSNQREVIRKRSTHNEPIHRIFGKWIGQPRCMQNDCAVHRKDCEILFHLRQELAAGYEELQLLARTFCAISQSVIAEIASASPEFSAFRIRLRALVDNFSGANSAHNAQ